MIKTVERKLNQGFTLVEILLVVAIIGVLATIVLSSVSDSRGSARDASRAQTMKQLEIALERYRNENNGQYPDTGNVWFGNCRLTGNTALTGASGYIPNLAPQFIQELPAPVLGCSGTNQWDGFLYRSDGDGYKLLNQTVYNTPQPTSAFYDPLYPGIMICKGALACAN